MHLLKPKDLSDWNALVFMVENTTIPFLEMYLPRHNREGWWGEFDSVNFAWHRNDPSNVETFKSPMLFAYWFDDPMGKFAPELDYLTTPSIPSDPSMPFTMLSYKGMKHFLANHNVLHDGSDPPVNYIEDMVNSNTSDSTKMPDGLWNTASERFTNSIKKARKKNMTTTQMNNDEKYVAAIMRPNVLTSEYYAETFLHSNEVSFTFHRTDPNYVLSVKTVDEWAQHYRRDANLTVSLEKGVSGKDSIRSVRMVVLNEKRELVLIWLFAGNSYSVHYKKHEEVSELLKFLKTTHTPDKRVIHRCYNGGGKIKISEISINGLYQIHDEFYPQLQDHGGMTKLLDDFRKSTSNLMILAGQWGGGKSALFQAICWADEEGKSVYYLLDDPSIYDDAVLFSSVISQIEADNRNGLCSWLFLEEADDFIRSKKNNPFLSRLASLTSGAAALNVKIITATNDGSESMIDSALTRAGRLFAMVKFGLLTPEQANAARKVLGKEPLEFLEDVALSEALTEAPVFAGVASTKKAAASFGFAPAKVS